MTNPVSNDDIDQSYSARYKLLADESVSDELNQAVLRTAAEAVGAGRKGLWQTNWLKSFAFIALVGLSFSLLLQTNDTPLDTMTESSPVSQPDSRFEDAGAATAARIRDAEVAMGAMQNKPEPAEESTTNPDSAAINANLPEDSACSETDRLDSGSWWRCIQSLERRGASAAAEQELVELLKSFPAFVQPR